MLHFPSNQKGTMDDAALLVCSNPGERSLYSRWLNGEGYPVSQAACASEAISRHEQGSFPLTVSDLGLPDLDGVELIRSVRASKPLAEFVVLSGPDVTEKAVCALKAGASDLLVKPVTRDDLLESVRKLWVRPETQHRNLEKELRGRYDFCHIVTQSPRMLQMLSLAGRVAQNDTTVLITGESGTGKELLARAIHLNSRRAKGPLVSINCAAIPDTLLESELFGYRKGAFTGAQTDKPGLLATAAGGTLFLDEVAELPLPTQAKLLRFLQEGTFFPVGSVAPATADVRLISATNSDLLRLVEEGAFRHDLYYRLAVFPLHIPPLRERPEDIIPLAQHFLQRLEARSGRKVPGLSREVVHYLSARKWHGNVRELESAIERAFILSDGSLLTSADFRRLDGAAAESDRHLPLGELPPEGVNLPELNRTLVVQALERTRFNVSAAARLLGLSRPALRYRMKKYGMHGA